MDLRIALLLLAWSVIFNQTVTMGCGGYPDGYCDDIVALLERNMQLDAEDDGDLITEVFIDCIIDDEWDNVAKFLDGSFEYQCEDDDFVVLRMHIDMVNLELAKPERVLFAFDKVLIKRLDESLDVPWASDRVTTIDYERLGPLFFEYANKNKETLLGIARKNVNVFVIDWMQNDMG